MDKITILPTRLNGSVVVPPSKSLSHRAIICACLADGESIIDNLILSEDILMTIEAMRQLGANIEIVENDNKTYKVNIKKEKNKVSKAVIDCKESGSTLRFIIPIAMMLSDESTFIGTRRLGERPLDVYYKIFQEQNIEYTTTKGVLPLIVKGKLKAGQYNISGSVSSQFVSGLLFALSLQEEDSIINIVDNTESIGYIDLTIDMMKKYGMKIENEGYKRFIVKGGLKYTPLDYRVESDYSQGAFFLVGKSIGNSIECMGLYENSLQGDKEILSIIERYDSVDKKSKESKEGSLEKEIVIDVSQIPDLVPIMTVLGALKPNVTTKIINGQRLRIKESDRLKAISTEMNKIGATVKELEDGLVIKGKETLKGGAIVSSWNDHRIAMALAIAATKCIYPIELEEYASVKKSYPGFWEDYVKLGGKICGLHMGE
ncbi:3-phosphoshikimate 1-carboxyvinyltransferase [Alkalibaculum bacchi]|uniref:3-phosphoshikimate 1-carboxyvinyltransferase n=1 Tax=Alkalibaculum bacchi TaxID=645887 RepID=A0A366I9E2_9FIRM|nr:3-phosphoshikimate 1-carboxyvinyltransferase [Alkalibaculum bacchi]RBP64409.1 3-phosphoshikimate 1-carboxyvinyltransferase [Alkalibaculum bacchi]